MASNNKVVLISDIVKFGNSLARSIRARLSWSTKLRKSVVLSTAKDNNGSVSISITVGAGSKDLSGMARAFEYGSGLHATRGTRRKYRIRPKNGKRLAFFWPGASPPYKRGKKLAGMLPDGRLSFFYVEHPGVRPRPFIKPALEATKAKAIKELSLAVRNNIKGILRITIREINSSVGR